MNLPRVVIDVAPRAPGPGWTVTVTGDSIAEEFAMDAITIDVDGREHTVPVHRDREELGERLARIEERRTRDGDVYAYGEWLFGCLLEPVWADIRKLPGVVAARGVELALRWPLDETVLHQLTWEAMCHEGIPLANDPDLVVGITRLVPADAGRPKTIERTPKVLFAVGGALLDDTIRPGAMFMGLLRAFDADGVCAAKAVQGVTSDDLGRYCAEFKPDVVHLVAHGEVVDGRGVVRLAHGEWAGADVLVPALTRGASRPLAVVLSACRTGSGGAAEPTPSGPLAAELVARGIPIVSAISGEVSEQACRLYSKQLIEAISGGTPLAKAVAQGRQAALCRTEPGRQLDWAMPALFVGESVEPDFRPVNREAAEWLVKAARELQLRELPVFVGRAAILEHVDDMFDPRKPLGVIGVVRHGSLSRLGGTRLLKEMGYQLLMRGHLPVLLGPYSPTTAPRDLRGFLHEVFTGVQKLAEPLGLTLPRFELFDYPEGPVEDARSAWRALLAALDVFVRDETRLIPALARDSLGTDLAALAAAAARRGEPFGDHTRVVLLADEIHSWPFAEELAGMLREAGEKGLGTSRVAAPFVFTASFQDSAGLPVKSLSERKYGQPGYAFPPLDELEIDEALLGFQWVLLNPWITDDVKRRKVYAALPGANWPLVRSLFDQLLQGKPAMVQDRLFYVIAHSLAEGGSFTADDDFAAWASYQGLST